MKTSNHDLESISSSNRVIGPTINSLNGEKCILALNYWCRSSGKIIIRLLWSCHSCENTCVEANT